jgi:hypothetical protein
MGSEKSWVDNKSSVVHDEDEPVVVETKRISSGPGFISCLHELQLSELLPG